MTKPWRFLRAALAIASVAAAQSCTVKQQNDTADLIGPSGLQSPAGAAAPTARFTVTPDRPTASVPVAFDGKTSCPEGGFTGGCIPSDRSITGFTWDFGDGTTESGATVSHAFKATGSFNVTLSVLNDRGVGSSTSKAVQVDPGTPPKADFVFSPTSPGVGQSVQFNAAQSTAAAGHNIASYSWDFGDGSKGSGITTSHSYASAGGYNVVLTVTDETGQINAASKAVTVAASQGPGAPTADFVFSPTDPSVGQGVLFNATQSKAAAGHSIASYAWNFGDGATGSGVTATHPFATVGTYAIVLVVTDDLGQTATSSKTVPVKAVGSTPPTASFVFTPLAPVVAEPVTFTASATPSAGRTIASYRWNFGDGTSPGSGASVMHTFTTASTLSVSVTVTDDVGQSVTVSNSVTVTSSAPTASFTFTPIAPGVGQTVSFDSNSSTATNGRSITSRSWNFGDGSSPTTGTNVNHAFGAVGTFNVQLTVTDDKNQSNTVTKQVTVGGPTAGFSFSPTDPVSGSLVAFNAGASSPLPSIVTFDWDFGDGTIINGQTTPIINHTFFTPTGNSFTVRLTVTDNLGRTGTITQGVSVKQGLDPTASFLIVSATPAHVNNSVSFDAGSSTAQLPKTIVRYEWTFGDNTTMESTTLTTKTHTYTAAGTYTITLKVVDSAGLSNTTSRTLVVVSP